MCLNPSASDLREKEFFGSSYSSYSDKVLIEEFYHNTVRSYVVVEYKSEFLPGIVTSKVHNEMQHR